MTSAPVDGRRPVSTPDHAADGGSQGPRNDQAAEAIVLGTLMLLGAHNQHDEASRVLGILARYGTQAFYRPIHADIYAVIAELHAADKPYDTHNVAIVLDSRGQLIRAGGAPYLHSLISGAPGAASGGYYAEMLLDLAKLRSLETAAIRNIQKARHAPAETADALLADAASDYQQLVPAGTGTSFTMWDDVALQTVDNADKLQKGTSSRGAPISTGIPDLDDLLDGGFREGQLIVVAGRPGMGKTLVGLHFFAETAFVHRLPFAWYSREMSALECGQRMIAARARVAYNKLRTGQLDPEDWAVIAKLLQETEGAPGGIDDSDEITMPHIEASMAAWARRFPDERLGGFGIDYAQLLDHIGASARLSREQQVALIPKRAKYLARKHRCPGILLAQLNREPDKRADKRPQLSDLRESGSIEQDADVVILLHADDYYDKESPRAGELDLIVAKHRGGRTDTVTVASQLHLQRITGM